jgi:NUMOD3 motif
MIHHLHHKIPRHMGGSDDPSNLVKLTIAEHSAAHKLLYETYGHWQDKLAWLALSGQMEKEDVIKEVQRNVWLGKKLSPEHKEKLRLAKKGVFEGVNNPNYGKPRSQEVKDKISAKLRGRKHTEETKMKIRASCKKFFQKVA